MNKTFFVLILFACIVISYSFKFYSANNNFFGNNIKYFKDCKHITRMSTTDKIKIDATRTYKFETVEKSIVLVAGFEAFNLALYKKAASAVMAKIPSISISVFTVQ